MSVVEGYRLAIDIGGTFTDVVFLDAATQRLTFVKVPTTPVDRSLGFFAGIDCVLEAANADPRNVRTITHGSTVATNAVLEGRGSRLGLITTLGFRDVLEIGRAYIPGIFTNFLNVASGERVVAGGRRLRPGRHADQQQGEQAQQTGHFRP